MNKTVEAKATGFFYTLESDSKGARVFTNMAGLACPTCKANIEPNLEHLCGDRAPKPKKFRNK